MPQARTTGLFVYLFSCRFFLAFFNGNWPWSKSTMFQVNAPPCASEPLSFVSNYHAFDVLSFVPASCCPDLSCCPKPDRAVSKTPWYCTPYRSRLVTAHQPIHATTSQAHTRNSKFYRNYSGVKVHNPISPGNGIMYFSIKVIYIIFRILCACLARDCLYVFVCCNEWKEECYFRRCFFDLTRWRLCSLSLGGFIVVFLAGEAPGRCGQSASVKGYR